MTWYGLDLRVIFNSARFAWQIEAKETNLALQQNIK